MKQKPSRAASDNLCKTLAEQYPDDFARWLFGLSEGHAAVLKTELSREPIRADSVLLSSPAGETLHVEFQTTAQSQTPLPLRMLDYYVGLKRQKPERRVRQVLVVLKETETEIPDRYEDERTAHGYEVIKMWEQDAALLLPHKGLLPLATLCRAASGEALLTSVADHIRAVKDKEQRRETVNLARVLAGLRFNKNLVYQFLRGSIVMEESVVYQDIIQKGVRRGRREGKQEGLQEGKKEGLHDAALSLLSHRFGGMPAQIGRQLDRLSLEQLESLLEAVWGFQSADDLTQWLKQQISPKKTPLK